MRAVLPVFFEILRRTRDFVFHALASFALLGICDGGQKVTNRLAWWTVPAHFQKVVFGLVARTEEDLPAFIQHNDFVEDVVYCLGGLVNCNCMTTSN